MEGKDFGNEFRISFAIYHSNLLDIFSRGNVWVGWSGKWNVTVKTVSQWKKFPLTHGRLHSFSFSLFHFLSPYLCLFLSLTLSLIFSFFDSLHFPVTEMISLSLSLSLSRYFFFFFWNLLSCSYLLLPMCLSLFLSCFLSAISIFTSSYPCSLYINLLFISSLLTVIFFFLISLANPFFLSVSLSFFVLLRSLSRYFFFYHYIYCS